MLIVFCVFFSNSCTSCIQCCVWNMFCLLSQLHPQVNGTSCSPGYDVSNYIPANYRYTQVYTWQRLQYVQYLTSTLGSEGDSSALTGEEAAKQVTVVWMSMFVSVEILDFFFFKENWPFLSGPRPDIFHAHLDRLQHCVATKPGVFKQTRRHFQLRLWWPKQVFYAKPWCFPNPNQGVFVP